MSGTGSTASKPMTSMKDLERFKKYLDNAWEKQRCSFGGWVSGKNFHLNTNSIAFDGGPRAVVQSQRPFSMTNSLCYYEITISRMPPNGHVVVGLAEEKFELMQLPGTHCPNVKSLCSSYGFHSNSLKKEGMPLVVYETIKKKKRRLTTTTTSTSSTSSSSSSSSTLSSLTLDPYSSTSSSSSNEKTSPIPSPRETHGQPENKTVLPAFNNGDTVGILLDNQKHTLYLTLNGRLVSTDPVFSNVHGSFYPTVGLSLQVPDAISSPSSTSSSPTSTFLSSMRNAPSNDGRVSIVARFCPPFVYSLPNIQMLLTPVYQLPKPMGSLRSCYVPTSWDRTKSQESFKVSEDGLGLVHKLSLKNRSKTMTSVLQSDEPFYPGLLPPLSSYSPAFPLSSMHPTIRYFEVEVLSLGKNTSIVIGLTPSRYPLEHHIGEEGSFGFGQIKTKKAQQATFQRTGRYGATAGTRSPNTPGTFFGHSTGNITPIPFLTPFLDPSPSPSPPPSKLHFGGSDPTSLQTFLMSPPDSPQGQDQEPFSMANSGPMIGSAPPSPLAHSMVPDSPTSMVDVSQPRRVPQPLYHKFVPVGKVRSGRDKQKVGPVPSKPRTISPGSGALGIVLTASHSSLKSSSNVQASIQKIKANDVIGVGFDQETSEIFFTKNGKYTNIVCQGPKGVMFPAISVQSVIDEVAEVRANFAGPFKFDIRKYKPSPQSIMNPGGQPDPSSQNPNESTGSQACQMRVSDEFSDTLLEFPSSFMDWEPSHVGHWVRSFCPEFADAFEAEHIAGRNLPDLDHTLLRSMGVDQLGSRLTILQRIEELVDSDSNSPSSPVSSFLSPSGSSSRLRSSDPENPQSSGLSNSGHIHQIINSINQHLGHGHNGQNIQGAVQKHKHKRKNSKSKVKLIDEHDLEIIPQGTLFPSHKRSSSYDQFNDSILFDEEEEEDDGSARSEEDIEGDPNGRRSRSRRYSVPSRRSSSFSDSSVPFYTQEQNVNNNNVHNQQHSSTSSSVPRRRTGQKGTGHMTNSGNMSMGSTSGPGGMSTSTSSSSSSSAMSEENGNGNGNGNRTISPRYLPSSSSHEISSDHDSIEYSDLKILSEIGRGASSVVYSAEYCGDEVAVKVLQWSNGRKDLESQFDKEVDIMRDLRHRNIVQFSGYCISPSGLRCIVTEKMGRSLNDCFRYYYLPRHREKLARYRCRYALDVAKGMYYLEKKKIIHRDLRPSNILLTMLEDGDELEQHAKVADFGLSRYIDANSNMTSKCGFFSFMAPEVYRSHKYSHRADIFSFGLICWFLFTGKSTNEMTREQLQLDPSFYDYEEVTQDWNQKYPQPMEIAYLISIKGWRPPLPADCPPCWATMICACWKNNPEERPSSFGDIIQHLKLIMKGYNMTYPPDKEALKFLDPSPSFTYVQPVEAPNGSAPMEDDGYD